MQLCRHGHCGELFYPKQGLVFHVGDPVGTTCTWFIDMLAKDISVTEVLDSLAYASPSNFIAMFRKAFVRCQNSIFLVKGHS